MTPDLMLEPMDDSIEDEPGEADVADLPDEVRDGDVSAVEGDEVPQEGEGQ